MKPTHRPRQRRLLSSGIWPVFAGVVLLVFAGRAWCQEAGPGSSEPGPEIAGQVTIQVRSFGLAGRGRPGSWAGIYLEFTETSDKSRNLLLRMQVHDVDGDDTWMQRVVASTPGDRRGVWLYAYIPAGTVSDTYTISAYEAIDSGDPDQVSRYRPGSLVGRVRYTPQANWSAFNALGVVVGRRDAGLRQFDWMFAQSRGDPVTGHEALETVEGVLPVDLPDAWQGLAAFETLVWTGAGSEEGPASLRADQAEAVREWVRRGGHLVVVLPPVSQGWIGAPGNPLADLMPRVRVERRENVDLEEYRALLTRDRRAALPTDAVVHTMSRAEAGPYDAISVMSGADDRAVVVRRLIGSGAVTVIGLDIVSPKLQMTINGFQADQFWNRVLGKRARLIQPQRLADEIAGKNLPGSLWSATRDTVEFDVVLAGMIAKSSNAAIGVLLALAVFSAYWVLAGPGAYFLLKKRGKVQHSWVMFVGAGLVFTGIAWGGANALKIRRVEGKHVTLLDIVYGQPLQRARSWVSLFLPSYGETRVRIGGGEAPGQTRNLLAPWAEARGGSTISAFPDARGYTLDAKAPDTAEFPSRATVKQVQIDWSGGLPARWGGLTPAADAQTPIGSEIRILANVAASEAPLDGEEQGGAARGQRVLWRISGVLSHNFPGPLKDVDVIYLREPESLAAPGDRVPLQGWCMRLSGDGWAPGQGLDLGALFADVRRTGRQERVDALLTSLRGEPSSRFTSGMMNENIEPARALRALTLFSMLTPPVDTDPASVMARRRVAHGYDLGRWFTQPCIIVIGTVEDAALPVPLSVDSAGPDQVGARVVGTTLVRWIYPLPATPAKPASTPE